MTASPKLAAAAVTAGFRKQVEVGRLFLGSMWMSMVFPFLEMVHELAVTVMVQSG